MNMKKWFCIVLTLMLILGAMTGCGKSSGEGTPEGNDAAQTPQEILLASADAMKNVTSYSGTMKMDMAMEMQGQEYSTPVDMNFDMFTSPIKMKMSMSMEIPGAGPMDVGMYMMQEGDNLTVYTNVGGVWQKTSQPFSEELMAQYDYAQYSQLFSESMKEASIAAEETVEGADCWKIDLTLDPSAFSDIMNKMQSAESMTEGITEEQLAALGDMNVTVWVEKETFYQKKATMDLTENMAGLLGDQGVTINRMTMDMTMSNFNSADEFELPAEALNATAI